MRTWEQHIASPARKWHIEVRIGGIGVYLDDTDLATVENDARLRWCLATPSWASLGLWKPYIGNPLPALFSEETDPLGGIPTYPAGSSVIIVDKGGAFSRFVKADRLPVSTVQLEMLDGDTGLHATPALTVGAVYWIGGEAVRVDGGTVGNYTVTREYLGTAGDSYLAGEDIYDRPIRIIGQSLELWLGPLDGAAAEMQRVMRSTITGIQLRDADTWELQTQCDAATFLKQRTPAVKRSITLTDTVSNRQDIPAVHLDGTFTGTVEAPSVPPQHYAIDGMVLQWTDGQEPAADEPHVYVQSDTGEVMGLRRIPSGALKIIQHDLLGIGGYDAPEAGAVLTQVFFDSSWRFSPGPTPKTGPNGMREASGWTKSKHVCDVLLNIMTSPALSFEVSGWNYDDNGNWSCLPGGYGLGIPIADINVATFLDVKRRHPDFIFDYALWGADERPAHEVLREVLRTFGGRLQLRDKIALVLPHLPLSSASLPTIDLTNILAHNDAGSRVLRISNVALKTARVGTIKFKVGPREVETTINLRGASDVVMMMPWVRDGAPFIARVLGRANMLGRDGWEFDVEVSASTIIDVVDGSFAAFSCATPPTLSGDDKRSTAVRMAEVLGQSLVQSREDGVTSKLRLRLYPQFYVSSLIGPSAVILGGPDGTEYVTSIQEFSEENGGVNDCSQFSVGDTVTLFNPDGTRATSLLETVVTITPPNHIELSGDFDGLSCYGAILGYPKFDEVPAGPERDFYMYLAALATRSPSADDPTLPPYVWGDS